LADLGKRSGVYRRLARAGLTLALTAGPVTAPADPLPAVDAAALPGTAEALLLATDQPGAQGGRAALPLAASPGQATLATPALQPGTVAVADGVTEVGGTPSAGSPPPVIVRSVTATAGTAQAQIPARVAQPTATLRSATSVGQDPVAPTPATTALTTPTQVAATPVAPTPVTPTPAVAPTLTPEGAPVPTQTAPALPAAYDDLGDLETFLIQYRSAIAGHPFDILSLTVDTTDSDRPYFVLSVASTETESVFGARSAEELVSYGRALLGDVKRYAGGGPCTIVIDSTYQASSTDACAVAQPWCQSGAHDAATNTWAVNWIYLWAGHTDGLDTLDVWNAAP
jgi:hypothetical protein